MQTITIYCLDERGERTTFDFREFADLAEAIDAAPEFFRRWTSAVALEFSDGFNTRNMPRLAPASSSPFRRTFAAPS